MNTVVYVAKTIITMNPHQPTATHVAVRDGRILAVGNADDVAAWGAFELDTRFANQVIMPGLVEGHCHLKEGEMWQWTYTGWYDRKDTDGKVWAGLRSMDAVVERLKEAEAQLQAQGVGKDQPLIAWGFDPIYFGDERMTVEHLDRVATDRLVVVRHASGHLLNVNSLALQQGGIDRDTEIEGVVRFANGEPNGELQEFAAMFPIFRLLNNIGATGALSDAAMRGFGRLARIQGVTTATDLVNKLSEQDVDILRRHTNDPEYPVRILPAFQAFQGPLGAVEGAAHVQSLSASNTDKLRFGLVKMMLDGSIQGYSARLRWPGYIHGEPNGIWVTLPQQYEQDFEVYHRAGLLIHTHTNGDEASAVAIDAIERVLTRAPRPNHRHTLQHGQMIDGAMFGRMRSLGLCANLFSNHLWYWGDQHWEMTMGPDRAHALNDARSALDAGVPLALHSDAPVTPLGPMHVAWAAVNRITPKGRILGAARRISVLEALHAITMGPAHTLKLDHETGSIVCGKSADFCVLEDNPLEIDPMALKDVRIWGTVLAGQVHPAQSE